MESLIIFRNSKTQINYNFISKIQSLIFFKINDKNTKVSFSFAIKLFQQLARLNYFYFENKDGMFEIKKEHDRFRFLNFTGVKAHSIKNEINLDELTKECKQLDEYYCNQTYSDI